MTIVFLEFGSFFYDLLQFLEYVFGNHLFLLIVTAIACFLKLYIAAFALSQPTDHGKQYARTLLLATLAGFIFIDIAWILQLTQLLLVQKFLLIRMFIRLSWAVNSLYFLAYALFVESLVTKHTLFKKRHIPLFIISGSFAAFFIYATINFHGTSLTTLLRVQALHNLSTFFLFMLPSIIFALHRLRTDTIPLLLKQQAKICIYVFIIPQVISDFLQLFPFFFTEGTFTNSFAIVGISTLFLTTMLYYCVNRIMGLRFLNVTDHVQSPVRSLFVEEFKKALEQLSQAISIQDIQCITDTFFSRTFNIPLETTQLQVRMLQHYQQASQGKLHTASSAIEKILIDASPEFAAFMSKHKIFIYDELEFSNFYKKTEPQTNVLAFLEKINADVFIPIYKDNHIIAAITTERYSRLKGHFYSDVERDEMLIFAQHLSNIIHLIQHRSFIQMVENERILENAIYQKTQQLQHYKESLGTLLRSTKSREIGVLFYRSRRFLLGNWIAQKLLGFDLGIDPKHAIAKQLKQIAERALELRATQTCFYLDPQKNKIIAYATPSMSQSHIIITLVYADAYDFIKDQISTLQNPHEWDYLLYLETTRSGQLINQLIPGSTKELLLFKIELLRTSFGKQPLLLDMAEDDFLPAVDIIHQIGLRNKLHVLHLKEPTRPEIMAPKLFGINPLLLDTQPQTALLEQLSGADTLFIQNIEFLDPVSQEHLVELIKYGYYRQYKSYHKYSSSVRIIVSSSQPLELLVQQGKYNQQLYEQLQKTSLRMPWLETLTTGEIQELAQQMSQQLPGVKKSTLSDRDLLCLNENRPTSLKEFKLHVMRLLKQQAAQPTHIIETITSNSGNRYTKDTDLSLVPRGRQALKNQKIMVLLWHKFKSQNEIAAFLGVNRSSVNRRCKQFNLG